MWYLAMFYHGIYKTYGEDLYDYVLDNNYPSPRVLADRFMSQ